MKRIVAIAMAAALLAPPVALAQSSKSKGVATDAPGHSTTGDPKAAAPGQQMKDPNNTTTGPGASQYAPGNPTPPAGTGGSKKK